MIEKAKALQRMQKYCALQDQSIQKVKEKLYDVESLTVSDREEIIDSLLADDFLNEIRFAKTYVRSKINQKRWGRYKIVEGLRRHRIHEKIISESILTIDMTIYMANLEHLFQIKTRNTQDKPKIIRFLQQKGYEVEHIFKLLG